jgi:hypothetical protein
LLGLCAYLAAAFFLQVQSADMHPLFWADHAEVNPKSQGFLINISFFIKIFYEGFYL